MASTIKLKNGSGAPTTGDLVQGEPALDLTNKRLYTENASGVVIEVGTNPSTIDINAGTIDGTVIGGSTAAAITGTTITGTSFVSSGDMTFGDNDKAIFGAGSDLQIYHDGSNSRIQEAGTGNLIIRADDFRVQSVAGESYIEADANGAVALRYDNALKLATTATGIDVTGAVTADGLTVDAGASDIAIVFDDNSVTNRYQFTTGGNSLDSYFNINSDATRAAHLKTVSGSVSFDIASGFGRNDINFNGADLFIKRGGTKALEVDQATGDVSLFEDTGTTAKFFWDASAESLGIGTSSPSAKLSLQTATGANNTSYNIIDATTDNPTYKAQINLVREDSSGKLGWAFLTNNVGSPTAAMNISAAGNVGIGTSSPRAVTNYSVLGINGTSGSAIDFEIGEALKTTMTQSVGQFEINVVPALPMVFKTSNIERARIDSSGNLLVGKTTSAINTDGVELLSSGRMFLTTTSLAHVIRRKSTDGALIEFQKDGTTVGSIGTAGGDITIGTGDTGLTFEDSADVIHPINQGTGSARDNAIDLGKSAARFKDLYLSGGVYLGGTGAANLLDDYEEGTWTPTLISIGYTFAYTTQAGIYTKIGNMVSVKLYLRLSGAPTGSGVNVLRIGSLPFTSVAGNASYSAGSILVESSDNLFAGVPAIRSNPSVTYLPIYDVIAGSSPASTFDCSKLDDNDEFQVSIVYHTA